MLKVYGCFVDSHDFRLVAVAVALCGLASFTAVRLLTHARGTSFPARQIWLTVAAFASGFGIWATHFVAMLAFETGLPTGYHLGLTVLSLVAAVALTGAGLSLGLARGIPLAPWLGGSVIGGGIAAMHYTGMLAFQTGGRLLWDPALVMVSIGSGILFGAAALAVALRVNSVPGRVAAGLLLTLAIASHHFIAMGAVTIVPDPTLGIAPEAIAPDGLAAGVALAGFAILSLTGAWLALDLRDIRRRNLEMDRMHGLANAAVEGLLICRNGQIVAGNTSFAAIVGCDVGALTGTELTAFLPDREVQERMRLSPDQPVQASLRHVDGKSSAVELIGRTIDFAGEPHHAVAIRDLREREDAERHIRFLAHHDVLTGLPNRAAFDAYLDAELAIHAARAESLAVFCLDLDRFKEVNDLFGHAAGDEILKQFARTIAAALGPNRMFARLGGDEFAIVIPLEPDEAAASDLASRILAALARESAHVARGTSLSASIGIAIYPRHGEDRETLLSNADTALYRAKADGRGVYRMYDGAMGATVRDRRLLEHDLRQALIRSQLRLVYQPQSVVGGDLIGFEALLRWQHPERGSVSPAVFIPVAEDTGVILEIGDWVLRTACREAASWANPLRIAVNVSALQIHSPNFTDRVRSILSETGLAPERLEIEITETALIRDFDRAQTALRELKALGLRIAMDDFGTGYSSLSNLRAFPFDKIKIDGSFVRAVDTNPEAAAIVRAVLGLGRGLGMPVLAEGVETRGELGFLADARCDEAQGFFLGRPADIETFQAWTSGKPADSVANPDRLGLAA